MQPLVNNAARHPRTIVQMLQRHPHTLCDETTASLCETAKVLVRAGHRKEVMEILNAARLPRSKLGEVLSALSGIGVH